MLVTRYMQKILKKQGSYIQLPNDFKAGIRLSGSYKLQYNVCTALYPGCTKHVPGLKTLKFQNSYNLFNKLIFYMDICNIYVKLECAQWHTFFGLYWHTFNKCANRSQKSVLCSLCFLVLSVIRVDSGDSAYSMHQNKVYIASMQIRECCTISAIFNACNHRFQTSSVYMYVATLQLKVRQLQGLYFHVF